MQNTYKYIDKNNYGDYFIKLLLYNGLLTMVFSTTSLLYNKTKTILQHNQLNIIA